MNGSRYRFAAAATAAATAALLLLCGGVVTTQRSDGPATQVLFSDVTRAAGIDFHHVNGASPDKHLVETIGSGGLFFDYDNDGWIDIFLVDGGSMADAAVARQARHRLFRNRRNGTFEDATERSGIRHRDYGMGGCAGDYDNDGYVDLYVTNLGPNVLYRNAGDGRFIDVTRTAHVGAPSWSTGCAFADLDRDGDLDLFVTNYVTADAKHNPFCGNAKLRVRFYCHPLNYQPLPNVVYRNNGNGSFADVSESSGVGKLRGNGLGVVITDFDDDRQPGRVFDGFDDFRIMPVEMRDIDDLAFPRFDQTGQADADAFDRAVAFFDVMPGRFDDPVERLVKIRARRKFLHFEDFAGQIARSDDRHFFAQIDAERDRFGRF